MTRYRIRHLVVMSVLLALPALTCGFGPAFQDLVRRVTALEAESDETDLAIEDLAGEVAALGAGSAETTAALEGLSQQVLALEIELDEMTLVVERELGIGPRTVLFDDDFEDGIDPAWVQVYGTTQTVVPTGDCGGAYWSKYASCGSLGLYFDEVERYDYELPVPTTGSFSLYFHDDTADTSASAWIGVLSPGNQERLGVDTSICPNHYYIAVNPGQHRCTIIPRRGGWHRVEFVRTGTITKGYIDYVLVFETNRPGRETIGLITAIQEFPGGLLDGFAIDDARFEAFD